MNVIICCVISLCCMAAHYFFPLYGYTGGNYILAKPLVGGLICGVLLGDVKTGLEIGCAIQLTYLSYMTIGGAATVDQGFLAYPITAIMTKMDAGSAIALGTAVAIIAAYGNSLLRTVNLFANNRYQAAIAAGDKKKQNFYYFAVPLFALFIVRFVPAFIMMYFGADQISNLLAIMPEKLLAGMSKFGSFMPAIGVSLLMKFLIREKWYLAFFVFGFALYAYYSVMYILWGMTYTIMDIPYWSIIPNLTSDPEEREKVSVLPRIFASIGQSLIIAGFGVQIIKGLGGNYTGYHRFALIIAATFIFTMAVCVINLPKKQQATGTAEKMKFRDIFTVIKKNDQLRWAVLLILLYNIGIQAIMGVATYYFSYVCNNAGMLSAFMISASVAEVVGLLIFPKVTKLLSRKKAFLMACTLPPIGLILLLIVGFVCPSNIPLTAIAGIIVKTGTGLELGCATVFLADVVDYGEYVLGVRNEGVVFSLQTLIVKLTAAFTALAIGFVLELTGYVPNAVQSLATQNSIRVLMCIVPALGIILAYVVFKTKYKLNDEFMKKVVAKISGKAEE